MEKLSFNITNNNKIVTHASFLLSLSLMFETTSRGEQQITMLPHNHPRQTNVGFVVVTNNLGDFKWLTAWNPVGDGVQLDPELFSCRRKS